MGLRLGIANLPGKAGIDQLVEIIKGLGMPAREQIRRRARVDLSRPFQTRVESSTFLLHRSLDNISHTHASSPLVAIVAVPLTLLASLDDKRIPLEDDEEEDAPRDTFSVAWRALCKYEVQFAEETMVLTKNPMPHEASSVEITSPVDEQAQALRNEIS
ncbi:MAG: hypothetical protein Q9168_005348 [Polycauliona sp. 1 TL-2023]